MTMSRDRIEFTASFGAQGMNDANATERALVRALGITSEAAFDIMKYYKRIRCRPSQFGRFIAYRVEEGVSNNRVKEMKVKLVKECPEVLDLSLNPHQHH